MDLCNSRRGFRTFVTPGGGLGPFGTPGAGSGTLVLDERVQKPWDSMSGFNNFAIPGAELVTL